MSPAQYEEFTSYTLKQLSKALLKQHDLDETYNGWHDGKRVYATRLVFLFSRVLKAAKPELIKTEGYD